jgi:two-component system NtrC family response regulator
MERLVLLSRTEEVTVADLPVRVRDSVPHNDAPKPVASASVTGSGLATVERDLIVRVLGECNWNRSEAARKLEISRKTLLYRMGKYGISKKSLHTSDDPGEHAAEPLLDR